MTQQEEYKPTELELAANKIKYFERKVEIAKKKYLKMAEKERKKRNAGLPKLTISIKVNRRITEEEYQALYKGCMALSKKCKGTVLEGAETHFLPETEGPLL